MVRQFECSQLHNTGGKDQNYCFWFRVFSSLRNSAPDTHIGFLISFDPNMCFHISKLYPILRSSLFQQRHKMNNHIFILDVSSCCSLEVVLHPFWDILR